MCVTLSVQTAEMIFGTLHNKRQSYFDQLVAHIITIWIVASGAGNRQTVIMLCDPPLCAAARANCVAASADPPRPKVA
jgi:hypothetical protein